MKKKTSATRKLPMPTIGSVVCSHHPKCASAALCIRRSMEYAMGKRLQPRREDATAGAQEPMKQPPAKQD